MEKPTEDDLEDCNNSSNNNHGSTGLGDLGSILDSGSNSLSSNDGPSSCNSNTLCSNSGGCISDTPTYLLSNSNSGSTSGTRDGSTTTNLHAYSGQSQTMADYGGGGHAQQGVLGRLQR